MILWLKVFSFKSPCFDIHVSRFEREKEGKKMQSNSNQTEHRTNFEKNEDGLKCAERNFKNSHKNGLSVPLNNLRMFECPVLLAASICFVLFFSRFFELISSLHIFIAAYYLSIEINSSLTIYMYAYYVTNIYIF